MDKRIIRILELVAAINEKGGKLHFKFSQIQLNVFDEANGCKQVLKLKDGFNSECNCIYLSDSYWDGCRDSFFNQAIRQLENILMNFNLKEKGE